MSGHLATHEGPKAQKKRQIQTETERERQIARELSKNNLAILVYPRLNQIFEMRQG